MKKLTLILLGLCALSAKAQNKITIDYAAPLTLAPAQADLAKPVFITLKNCNLSANKTFFAELSYKGMDKPPVKLVCGNETKIVDLNGFFTDKTHSLTITVKADQVAGDKKFDFSFFVKPDGQTGASEAGAASEGREDKVLIIDTTNFVPASLLDPRFTTVAKECRYPLLTYNPCCNCYELVTGMEKNKDSVLVPVKKGYLSYHSNIQKNKGVVFLIRDFNTLLYDITVGNTFEDHFTDTPALFSAVYQMIGATGGGQSTADDEFQNELAKLVKLNSDLKRYLAKKLTEDGCTSSAAFEEEKAAIAGRITKSYNLAGSLLTIDDKYNVLKEQIVAQNPDADFNEGIQKTYSLPVTPDSLVRETKKILNLIMTTKFEYQYNVPQIQNADVINFTLNIQPKTGNNGSIHVTNQPLTVPIRGGIKMDFSSGLYYSSISNFKYSLRDQTAGDSVQSKNIVAENGKRNGGRTVGVMALMHIYPRMGDFQPSFSFGFGKSIDLNYSVLVGGSIMFGKQNRFALSGGFNFSSIQTLSSKYYDDKGALIQSQLKSVSSLDTYNRIKRGGFIGFSYSILGSKKSQQASSSGDAVVAADTPADKGKTTDAKK